MRTLLGSACWLGPCCCCTAAGADIAVEAASGTAPTLHTERLATHRHKNTGLHAWGGGSSQRGMQLASRHQIAALKCRLRLSTCLGDIARMLCIVPHCWRTPPTRRRTPPEKGVSNDGSYVRQPAGLGNRHATTRWQQAKAGAARRRKGARRQAPH